jgi:misacylated tRNA(Ala) deacylase
MRYALVREPSMTERLYLDDPYLREVATDVLESAAGACTLSRTVFHPGGGGQPHDRGTMTVGDEALPLTEAHEDDAGRIWHVVGRELSAGTRVVAALDWPYRHALMRHHALMHIVNTVARVRFGGVITGAQLGAERSRIDFRFDAFGREDLQDFEDRVNAVVTQALAVTSTSVTEEEFRARPELVRTLNVAPPVVDGRVRVVEIAGFDAQACGGTHVHTTGEIGRVKLVKLDNKGRDNKRLYWELAG